jgi:ribosome recycling factor
MAQPQAFDINDIRRRMKGAVQVLKEEFAWLRSGRASAHLLEPITVEAYGSQLPMTQVGTISVPEPRMITVQVWDRSLVHAVDKAIRMSSLGLNPIVEGQTLRVPIPELSAERRRELSKVAHQYAEKARVAVRNVRRDGMEQLKRLDRDGHISEDEHKARSADVQKATDETVKEIDTALAHKDAEIMQV